MKTLAIIPARGGSKGVPRKNIRLLGGKPLIAYTIEAARASQAERVVVTTDDPEIAAAARAYGAEVPFLRPASLAHDTASSLSALLHTLHHLAHQEGYHPDAVAFLQPTSPFRTGAHIDEGLTLLQRDGVDSVVSVTEADQHPYVMFDRAPDGRLGEYAPLPDKPVRRQDFPPLYVINGAMYLSHRAYFDGLDDPSPVFSWTRLQSVVLDRYSAVDINNEIDFMLAEAVLNSGLVQPQTAAFARSA